MGAGVASSTARLAWAMLSSWSVEALAALELGNDGAQGLAQDFGVLLAHRVARLGHHDRQRRAQLV